MTTVRPAYKKVDFCINRTIIYIILPERFQDAMAFLKSNGFTKLRATNENGRDVITIYSTREMVNEKMWVLNEASKLSDKNILIRGITSPGINRADLN
ncbi:MAG: hypothetical protein A3B68_02510 [Candidatus Melainabacteria bacterium RIFCSPHIGHO2_02_FULL_34_12]|nr:MAG: hypothetical protein A3B68_02510 [Candidatus Melainabacteria bacterium RIFCSPHIGHO2_02_FULL_34_12]